MRTITESESDPRSDGFRMPGEFEPQTRAWMAWPHRTDTWAWGAKPAQKQYAAVARAIAQFECDHAPEGGCRFGHSDVELMFGSAALHSIHYARAAGHSPR